MDNFNEKTDIDINLFIDSLLPIYNPISDRIAAENPKWKGTKISDEAIKELNKLENFEIKKVDDCGEFWVIRFPTEQHKLQYLLKHT